MSILIVSGIGTGNTGIITTIVDITLSAVLSIGHEIRLMKITGADMNMVVVILKKTNAGELKDIFIHAPLFKKEEHVYIFSLTNLVINSTLIEDAIRGGNTEKTK